MSLNDIPGTVTMKRQWPLGLVLALHAATLWFVFETRANGNDAGQRLTRLEAKEEKRTETEMRLGTDIAVIKAGIEAIREQLREERRRGGEPR